MIKKSPLYVFLLICLLFETNIVLSQNDSVVSRIIQAARTDNRTMDHLDILSNRIGGRLVGSDAYENATYWAAGLFSKWGLEVSIQAVDTLPVGFNRGPWFGRMLSEDGFVLHFVTPSYTAGTKGVGRDRSHFIYPARYA